MSVLGVIPARGGSKGIPRKNIRPFSGKALIIWSIDAALQSGALDAVVVSTDDEEIAAVAREAGAAVPFMRPAELATDESPTIDTVLHALDRMPAFDEVMLLQPTSPLRSSGDIAACISLARARRAPSVVAVSQADPHPYWMYELGPDGRLKAVVDRPAVTRRQDLPDVYAVNGALYYARADWLRASGAFITGDSVAYVMPAERSVDVDTDADWRFAEWTLEGRP
jgi:CMP-N,N'-diacetyllegionaminic acid synthase